MSAITRTGSSGGVALRLLSLLALLLAVGVTIYVAREYAGTRKALPSILPRVVGEAIKYPPLYGGSITGVTTPNSVAVSPDGERIYVTESEGERTVKVFNASTGALIQRLAPAGSTTPSRKPMYVAVSSKGRVFVSDSIRPMIHMYGPAGEYIGVYQPEEAESGWMPLGLNFQANGNLAVTDVSNAANRVLSFLPNEILETTIDSGPAGSKLSYPSAAVQDSRGRWYVSDSNNSRLLIYEDNGRPLEEILATDAKRGMAMPRGMAIDGLGRLYVADASSSVVNVYQTGDKLEPLFSFGESGLENGSFRMPNGVAVDAKGRIWIADWGNNRVQMWRY